MATIEEFSLEFTSCRAGEGRLTWAQKSMWNNIQAIMPADQHLNMTAALPVTNGPSLAQIMEALRVLVSRHDALRTTYPRDAAGQPYQQVAPGGATPVVQFTFDTAGEEQLADVMSQLAGKRFDITAELPLRVGLIADHRAIRQVAVCLSHMAVDGWARNLLLEELGVLLSPQDGSVGLLEPVTRQPLEQAQFEQDVLVPRQGDRVARYWREILRACPTVETLPERGNPSTPRFWHGTYWSEAAATAAGVLAARYGVSQESVILGAVARVVLDYTGRDVLPTWLRVSNRFAPEVRRSVMYLCQNSPTLLAGGGVPFAELARSAHSSALLAYRYSQYDPDVLSTVWAEVHDQRSCPVDLSATLNIVPRGHQPRPAGWTPDAAKLRELTHKSSFSWKQGFENERIRMFISLFGGTTLEMIADTCYVPPAEIEATLRGVEELLVAEATGRSLA